MPKIAGRVLASKIIDGAMLAKIQLNGRLPMAGENVTVKWGSVRSYEQNRLLWAYYTYVINDCGLKDQGFFCPEALHESLKAHFLADKIMSKGEWKAVEEGSTAVLTKSEFSEYMEKIDHFICDFFTVDTSVFWEELKRRKDEPPSMELTEEGKRAKERGEF